MKRQKPLIFTFGNQKGGTGKSTSLYNLSTFAALSNKVLVIDADPQCNLTNVLIQPEEGGPGLYELLTTDLEAGEVITGTNQTNLSLIPASIFLANLERIAVNEPTFHNRLKEKLADQLGNFDQIYIDTPPTLGSLLTMALFASTHLIITVQASYFSLMGTNDLFRTLRLVQRSNPIDLAGILITMHNRTNLAREVEEEVRETFGDKVFTSPIHRSVKLEESPALSKSIHQHAPKSRSALEYQAVFAEVMSRV